jgi:hypothetical protein
VVFPDQPAAANPADDHFSKTHSGFVELFGNFQPQADTIGYLWVHRPTS